MQLAHQSLTYQHFAFPHGSAATLTVPSAGSAMVFAAAKLGITMLCLRAAQGVGPCSRALPQPSKRMKAPFPYDLAACSKDAASLGRTSHRTIRSCRSYSSNSASSDMQLAQHELRRSKHCVSIRLICKFRSVLSAVSAMVIVVAKLGVMLLFWRAAKGVGPYSQARPQQAHAHESAVPIYGSHIWLRCFI